MRLTESRLRQIIREEIKRDLDEGFWDNLKSAGKEIKDAGKSAISKVTGKSKEQDELITGLIKYLATADASKIFPDIATSTALTFSRRPFKVYPTGILKVSFAGAPKTSKSMKLPEFSIDLSKYALTIDQPKGASPEILKRIKTTITSQPDNRELEDTALLFEDMWPGIAAESAEIISNMLRSSVHAWFKKTVGHSMPDETIKKWNEIHQTPEIKKKIANLVAKTFGSYIRTAFKELAYPKKEGNTFKLTSNGKIEEGK